MSIDKIKELIQEYENEIQVEKVSGNIVKLALNHGIVMGLRFALEEVSHEQTKKTPTHN